MSSPLVEHLRAEVQRVAQQGAAHTWSTVSSGFAELDRLLPAGGLRCGTLVEWLAAESGHGATSCALRAAHAAMADDRPLVVVDIDDSFHPPGLPAAIEPRRVLLVRCTDRRQLEWAVDQALRTSGVGAVLARYDVEDERRLRRWQLAAETSGALGLIVRTLPRQPEVCFSDVRIGVIPGAAGEGRQVRLELLRCRQGGRGAALDVRLDDDAYSLSQTLPDHARPHTLATRTIPSRSDPPRRRIARG